MGLLAVLLLYDETTALIALALVGSFLLAVLLEWLQVTRAISTAAEITPTQYPAFYPLVEDLRQRFALPQTRVFIRYYPDVPHAIAYGVHEPYVILLDELLVSYVDEEELGFVLARQMAHIKLGHTRLRTLLGVDDEELPALVEWLNTPRQLAFAWWRRTQTQTADRAGLLACGRLQTSISALAKANIGPWLEIAVNVEALRVQAAELSHGWRRIAAFLTYVAEPEPPLVLRVQAMREWAEAHAVAEGEAIR
jgi:Zn-dependent protease with chaperone function